MENLEGNYGTATAPNSVSGAHFKHYFTRVYHLLTFGPYTDHTIFIVVPVIVSHVKFSAENVDVSNELQANALTPVIFPLFILQCPLDKVVA